MGLENVNDFWVGSMLPGLEWFSIARNVTLRRTPVAWVRLVEYRFGCSDFFMDRNSY